MKTLKFASAIFGCLVMANANAANIKIFHSPTCPHCHHARGFIESTLIYEYDNLKVTEVNVANEDNRSEFFDALKKCNYKTGGVPVIVIHSQRNLIAGVIVVVERIVRNRVRIGIIHLQGAYVRTVAECMLSHIVDMAVYINCVQTTDRSVERIRSYLVYRCRDDYRTRVVNLGKRVGLNLSCAVGDVQNLHITKVLTIY